MILCRSDANKVGNRAKPARIISSLLVTDLGQLLGLRLHLSLRHLHRLHTHLHAAGLLLVEGLLLLRLSEHVTILRSLHGLHLGLTEHVDAVNASIIWLRWSRAGLHEICAIWCSKALGLLNLHQMLRLLDLRRHKVVRVVGGVLLSLHGVALAEHSWLVAILRHH